MKKQRVKNIHKGLLLLALTLFGFSSCATLKPYERVFVDDPDMQMSLDAGLSFQQYIQSIREGSTPPSSAKGSGGCGCNE